MSGLRGCLALNRPSPPRFPENARPPRPVGATQQTLSVSEPQPRPTSSREQRQSETSRSSSNRGASSSRRSRAIPATRVSTDANEARCSTGATGDRQVSKSGHENASEGSVRGSDYGPGTRYLGAFGRTQRGQAAFDDGLRAREIGGRPLRLAWLRCERGSVGVVGPQFSRVVGGRRRGERR